MTNAETRHRVIQPVLLCSVLRRFVHATGCGKHLFVIIIIISIIITKLTACTKMLPFSTVFTLYLRNGWSDSQAIWWGRSSLSVNLSHQILFESDGSSWRQSDASIFG